MKKLFIAMAATASVCCLSCNEEFEQPAFNGRDNLAAVIENTKTELGEDGFKVNWIATDDLSVFDGEGTNTQFNAMTVDGSEATFNGTLAVPAATIYAVYPFYAPATISGTEVSTNLPSVQAAKKGSFADGVNIAAGSTASFSDGCTFYNVLGLLKVTVPAELTDIVKIEFSAAETLAGDFTINLNDAMPVAVKGAGSKTVTLTNSGAPIAPGVYYVAVLPGQISGLSVKLTDSLGETAEFANTTPVTINAGKIRSVGTVKWDYKKLYDAGQTIKICGRSYSKAVNGASKEVVATTPKMDIPKNNSLGWQDINSGVVFLSEANDSCSFTVAQIRKVGSGKDIAFVGRYKGQRPTITGWSNSIQMNGGNLSFCNVTFDKGTGSNVISHNAASEGLYFDNCVFKDKGGNQIVFLGTTSAGITNLAAENCIFDLNTANKGGVLLFNASNCAVLSQYKSVKFKNNIVYNPVKASLFTVFSSNWATQTAPAGGEVAIIENNTFYNACSGYNGLVKTNHMDSVSFRGNLLHLNTTGYGFGVYSVATAQTPVCDIKDSYAFGLYSTSWTINKTLGQTTGNYIPMVYPSTTDPLPNVTNAYGDFTPISKYAKSGAKR